MTRHDIQILRQKLIFNGHPTRAELIDLANHALYLYHRLAELEAQTRDRR